MGTYVDGYVYEIDKLKSVMEKKYNDNLELVEGKIRPSELLDIVMPEFGLVVDNHFFLLSNEHAEDFNAHFGLIDLLEKYYGPDPNSSYRGLFDLFDIEKEAGKKHVDGYGPDYGAEEWIEKGLVGYPEEDDVESDY